MSAIGVIIVDYQSDPLLEKALLALASTRIDIPFRVVIIENSPRRTRPNIPEGLDVKFFPQEKNLGFGRAVNLARRNLQTPYFLLLNPDVKIFPNTLSILCDYMERNTDVGIAVPKLLDSQGNLQLSARRFYDLPTILLRRTFLGRFYPDHQFIRKHLMADWDHETIKEIDWALGACMLIRSKAVGDHVFDPRFFLYFEDVDLCVRLKKVGWKVVYHPEAIAVHEHLQESRRNPFSRANYAHFVSWIKFMIKHRSISGIR